MCKKRSVTDLKKVILAFGQKTFFPNFYVFWNNFLGSFCHYAMLTFLESKKKQKSTHFYICYNLFQEKICDPLRMGFAFF